MKILIIGAGGREHALARIYRRCKKIKKVFVVPGNDLMTLDGIKIFPQIKALNFNEIISLIKKYRIDFVDVAQEDPLAEGFVDKLKSLGIKTFGPTKKTSEIEWSKEWSRNFMKEYNLPIPFFKFFNNKKGGINFINSQPDKIFFIKASGLAAGKGAIRAKNKKEAIEAINQMSQFGKAGETFLIEECLTGEEFSLFAICDGENYKIIKTAQDHKTVFEKDLGQNTGGMGCVSPITVVNQRIIREIESKILKPFMRGMKKEGRPYSGVLYLGGMISGIKVRIIEFNARWGDPEAEVILPGFKTDYLKIVEAVEKQKLKEIKIIFDKMIRISITGCSHGYPNDYSKVIGKEIFGLEKAMKLKGITIFGAGIKILGKRFFVNGGRIFHLVTEGKNITEIRRKAYEAMSLIYIEDNNLHYRTDIGWREMERKISK
ncbi:MAG: phosphoribosylamine--glycine ligase [bacterium]|nr:phosphoribosylamine--glycine ligase [bacterium]